MHGNWPSARCRTPSRRLHALVLCACLGFAACSGGDAPEEQAIPLSTPWIAAEKQRFLELLAAEPADILVVPFQIDGYGFDAAERSLVATRIANYLGASSGLSVADPQLVGRALGEGWRQLELAEIRALAEAMRARHVVYGEIGHDRESSFRITVRTWTAATAGQFGHDVRTADRSWERGFSDDRFPHQRLQDLLPSIGELLHFDTPRKPQPHGSPTAGAPPGLPELDVVLEPRPVSVPRLHLLQLLAVAHPASPDAAERAWVRTLELAYRLPGDLPGRTLLVARALAHLGRRPAALHLLTDAQGPAEQSLRAVLDGSLPQAERQAAAIEDAVQRLIAQVELRDLRWAYQHTSDEREAELLAEFVPSDSDWWPLLHRRVTAVDNAWVVSPSFDALAYFDRYFPLSPSGQEVLADRLGWLWESAESRGGGVSTHVAMSAAALEHRNQWVAEHASELAGGSAHGTWLLLDLLAANAEADTVERVSLTLDYRGQIDQAREDVAAAERYFAGHPEVVALKAGAEWKEYNRQLGAERARWLAAGLRDTEEAFALAQRMTPRLGRLERRVPHVPAAAERLGAFRARYFWDLPGSFYWPAEVHDDPLSWPHYRETVLAYATYHFGYVQWLLSREEDETAVQRIRHALDTRFDGNAAKTESRAAALKQQGDLAAAEREYRLFLAGDPGNFSSYDSLAEVLVNQGRISEAFEVLEAYPGFADDSTMNRVALSNNAQYAGMLFFPIGRFEYAMPLFRRSAEYNTGSAASLHSQAVLAQDRQDFRTAAGINMKSARRYANLEALNRYLALAFALGDYENAWAVFDEVHRDGNGGMVVATMARSARTQGWSDRRIREWLHENRVRELAYGSFRYAAYAATAAFVVDREPPADFPELLSGLQGTSPYLVDEEGRIVRRRTGGDDESEAVICGPSAYAPDFELSGGDEVESHLVYFAEAYLALSRGEYAGAHAAFEEAAAMFRFFGHDCMNVSYMLPYFAYAAAMARETDRLANWLDEVPYEHRTTHFQLARAVLAGIAGKEEDALAALDAALHRWESSRYRAVPTPWLYADICRRLHEATGSAAYLERLLWWVRARQRIGPTDAWPYALEARYAGDADEKRRALAMTLLLDRHSGALGDATDTELEAARRWLASNNPFR